MRIQEHIAIKKLTFWGVGGTASRVHWAENLEELKTLWRKCWTDNTPIIVLGRGSNTALPDGEFSGFIMRISDCSAVKYHDNLVEVEAGKLMQELVYETCEKGYEDMAALSGIPGEAGAFVRGNAGAFGLDTCDIVHQVEYVTGSGEIKIMPKSELKYAYRWSIFKDHPDWCITRIWFELNKKSTPEEATSKAKELYENRWQKYPPGRTGGSTFKNPGGNSHGRPGVIAAGKLLDDAGAKGQSVGDMEFTTEHANFIRNKRNGTQADLITLMRKYRDKVQSESGILIHPEVVLYGENGEIIEL